MSEADVLREGLDKLAKELDAIEALLSDNSALEEAAQRLREAKNNIGLTLQEARSDIAAETELAARDELELPDDVF